MIISIFGLCPNCLIYYLEDFTSLIIAHIYMKRLMQTKFYPLFNSNALPYDWLCRYLHSLISNNQKTKSIYIYIYINKVEIKMVTQKHDKTRHITYFVIIKKATKKIVNWIKSYNYGMFHVTYLKIKKYILLIFIGLYLVVS